MDLDNQGIDQEQELENLKLADDQNSRTFQVLSQKIASIQDEKSSRSIILSRLVKERDELSASLVHLRQTGRAELEILEEQIKARKQDNSVLGVSASEKENVLRRLKHEAADLETQTIKEREEIYLLEKMMKGGESEEDAILTERNEIFKKIDNINQKNDNLMDLIKGLDHDIVLGKEQYLSVRKAIGEKEDRSYSLSDQFKKVLAEKKAKLVLMEDVNSKLSTVEESRCAIARENDTKEEELSGRILKELKDLRKTDNTASTRIKTLEQELNAGTCTLMTMDKEFDSKKILLNSLETENEFWIHQIDSLFEYVNERERLKKTLLSKIDGLRKNDGSNQLQELRSENDSLRSQIQQYQMDIRFLSENGMLDERGVVKPLLIEAIERPGTLSLVERLNINEFLVATQAQADIQKIQISLIEKISQLLEMINEAERLETRYTDDIKRSEEISKQLSERNLALQCDISNLEKYTATARIQLGMNQVKMAEGRNIKLYLAGMGFTDDDLSALVASLTQEERGRIDLIDISNNCLVEFNLSRIVSDCPLLKSLDIRGNKIVSLNECERFLRQKMEGITSVFKDDKLMIANSGTQIRISVHHGELFT
jgi:hypothetical protein